MPANEAALRGISVAPLSATIIGPSSIVGERGATLEAIVGYPSDDARFLVFGLKISARRFGLVNEPP
jgi:hypothetical protein